MALIKCKCCDKDVSDRAKTCPHCGTILIEDLEITENEEKVVKVCNECLTKLSDDAKVCPNCGCPVPQSESVNTDTQKVEVTAVNLQMKQSTKKTVIAATISIIAIILAIIIISSIVKGNNAKEYASDYAANLRLVSTTMLMGAADAESAGNTIKSVWYNSIYEVSDSKTDKYTKKNNGYGSFYSDFNDALVNLFSDSSFSSKITKIQDNQDKVENLMRQLKNPPEEYAEAYEAVKECYEAYLDLTNLAISPNGSLQTFSNSFNDADSEMLKRYNALKIYID